MNVGGPRDRALRRDLWCELLFFNPSDVPLHRQPCPATRHYSFIKSAHIWCQTYKNYCEESYIFMRTCSLHWCPKAGCLTSSRRLDFFSITIDFLWRHNCTVTLLSAFKRANIRKKTDTKVNNAVEAVLIITYRLFTHYKNIWNVIYIKKQQQGSNVKLSNRYNR